MWKSHGFGLRSRSDSHIASRPPPPGDQSRALVAHVSYVLKVNGWLPNPSPRLRPYPPEPSLLAYEETIRGRTRQTCEVFLSGELQHVPNRW